MRTSRKTDFRSSKNNFRGHDISQGLDREPPSLSPHFLLVHSITTSQDENTEKCALVSRIHFSELRTGVLEEKTHLTDKGGVRKLYNHNRMSIHSNN